MLAVAGCDEFTEKVLKNPALPPVRILPNPGGEPIELVKDGKLQFCLVGDFKKEAAIKLPFRQQESVSNVNTGRASRRMCARFLMENFQKTVGKSPEMLECDDPKVNGYKYVVVCGKCRFTDEVGLDPDKLDIDEFVVSHLSEQEQRIFRSRFTDGCSYDEIAAAEDISRVAVWKHLSHALNLIRNHFN